MGIDAKLFVRTFNPRSQAEIRELAARLWEATYGDGLYIPTWNEKNPYQKHCLETIEEYWQDGPSIIPEAGEQFIEVNLMQRYYGPGYERGSWPTIASITAWLQYNIPDGEIWYGGDSSGVLAIPLTDEALQKLWEHWFQYGHAPYQEFFSRGEPDKPICPRCNIPLRRFGWGHNYASYSCGGCSYQEIHRDGTIKKGDNIKE